MVRELTSPGPPAAPTPHPSGLKSTIHRPSGDTATHSAPAPPPGPLLLTARQDDVRAERTEGFAIDEQKLERDAAQPPARYSLPALSRWRVGIRATRLHGTRITGTR